MPADGLSTCKPADGLIDYRLEDGGGQVFFCRPFVDQRLDVVKDLASYNGKAFLGIDAGSTTTKTALVGEDGTLLYSFYSNNEGDPLGIASWAKSSTE